MQLCTMFHQRGCRGYRDVTDSALHRFSQRHAHEGFASEAEGWTSIQSRLLVNGQMAQCVFYAQAESMQEMLNAVSPLLPDSHTRLQDISLYLHHHAGHNCTLLRSNSFGAFLHYEIEEGIPLCCNMHTCIIELVSLVSFLNRPENYQTDHMIFRTNALLSWPAEGSQEGMQCLNTVERCGWQQGCRTPPAGKWFWRK